MDPCRRCSECQGEAHHWMGPDYIVADDSPCTGDEPIGFICKHCDHTSPSIECGHCGEDFPFDLATAIEVCDYSCPWCTK